MIRQRILVYLGKNIPNNPPALHKVPDTSIRRPAVVGHGSPGKTSFVVAVQCSSQGHPLAMRMDVVTGFRKPELALGKPLPGPGQPCLL